MNFNALKISAICVGLCAACSSGDKNALNVATPWLGTLNGFKRITGEDEFGVFQRNTPGKTARFERGIVLPSEIVVSARSDLGAVQPETYEKIKALFSDTVQAEMAKKFPTANGSAQSAGASHQIKVALTGLTVTRMSNNAFAARLNDLRFSFENAKIETEIREAKSNTRQAAIVLPATGQPIGWDTLRDQLAVFARETAAETGKALNAINTMADQPPPAAEAPAKK
jgi:hypothetical protein